MNDFFTLIIFLPPFAILLIVGLFLKRRFSEKKWFSQLTKPKTLYWTLFILTLLGFFSNLDYTMQWGCIIENELIFSKENIFFSVTALALLTVGFFLPLKKIGILILFIELAFWIYKLFIIKGGYVTGIGACPDSTVLTFDIMALTLRLALLKQILKLKFRTIYILILSFVIMFIKVQFFT